MTETYIFTARCKHFTTGREIGKEVVDGLFHEEDVGNKLSKAFLRETLVEDKKSLLEPFYNANLITRNKKKKKFLKPLSIVEKICHAFDLLINKVVKFTETLTYAITSVPLAVAILNRTLYQLDKAGLRSYIINLPRSPCHEYPREFKWQVDGIPFSTSTCYQWRIVQSKPGIFQSREGILE